MATTKKPTGLKITRKDNKYIFSWSKPQTYGDGQQLQWSYKSSKTHKSKIIKLSGSRKDYTVTSPSKLSLISFKVRGNHDQSHKDPGWSAWASKSFKVYVPKQPVITATWEEATPNKTVFTYETKDEEHYPFDHVEYRTMWVQDYNGDPESYDWTGTPTTSTAKTGTIFDTAETLIPSESWTRIVQIRAVGAGGTPKKWTYDSHTYAQPNEPAITKATAKEIPSKSMTTLDLEWNTSEDSAHPIDKTVVQYKMTVPDTGMSFPAGEDPTDADTPVNVDANTWSEEVSGILADDQCLFARIKVTHDTRDNVSDYKIALAGKLAVPTSVTTTPNQGTHTIVVNITSATTVPDAYHAVVYKKDGTESILGIIPNGSSSVNMVVPPWTDSVGDVGVYAVVGSYTAQPADSDGVIIYTIASPQMTSDTVWKGVLSAPSIKVVQADVEETATVTWSWTDPDATGAEVSWADHEDAWESTDEPDTYIVDASRASRLNVSGLDPGIMWYFRVRLVTEGDDTTYGLYSNTFALNLSSAPAIPSLEMSSQVIDPDGEAIASWVYVSGDNTPQAHATLALYNGTYTDILQVNTEQTAVIKPAKLELAIGSYQLAVKVESESGQWSDYSDPVPFAVAQPLTCTFTQTSLVSDEEPINPETFTGNPIILDAGDPAKEVKNLDVELTPVQDLHGYDKPWAGGAGKNLLNIGSTVSQTTANVTYTSDDNYITMNGTKSGGSYALMNNLSLALTAGTYYARAFAISGTASNTPSLYAYQSADLTGNLFAEEKTFTLSADGVIQFRFGLWTDGATFTNYKVGIVVSKTSGITEWTPYSNICPITGHDSVPVTDSGKNLFDKSVLTESASWVILPVTLPNGTYTMSTTKGTQTATGLALYFRLKGDTTLGSSTAVSNEHSVTRTGAEFEVVFRRASGTDEFANYDYQIEVGSTATSIAPYHGQSKTVTLPHTVYGAGVGVTSGSGKEKMAIVDLGDLNYTYQANLSRFYTTGIKPTSAKPPTIQDVNAICSSYYLSASGNNGTFLIGTDGTLYIWDTAYTDATAFKQAMQGVMLCYELATPTDLSTTPTDLTLYNGDNVISSDGVMTLEVADAVLDGYFLKEMPLTATVTGAGETGQTVLTIKRKNDYSILRPDDTELTGYANEVICQYVYTGEAQRTINISDVLGKLNDGATYYLEATVTDNLGRTATARYPNDDPNNYFTVLWDLQAIMPEATAEIIDDYYAKLTITKPQDWYEGDTVDIYRLTSDKPQLIADGVEMEDTPVEYVDPYPTLGEGGYRFVYRTQNGDDTLDSANNFAWLDIPLTLESQEAIIDFNGERLPLGYNLKVANSWAKDFQETRYLGGHIAGDWTAGVSRTASVDTVTIPVRDPSLFKSIRRLAEYEDICHLRTLDGSVITCNIQVDDDFGYDTAGKIQNVKMSITRVDPVDMDSMLLSDWLVTP